MVSAFYSIVRSILTLTAANTIVADMQRAIEDKSYLAAVFVFSLLFQIHSLSFQPSACLVHRRPDIVAAVPSIHGKPRMFLCTRLLNFSARGRLLQTVALAATRATTTMMMTATIAALVVQALFGLC